MRNNGSGRCCILPGWHPQFISTHPAPLSLYEQQRNMQCIAVCTTRKKDPKSADGKRSLKIPERQSKRNSRAETRSSAHDQISTLFAGSRWAVCPRRPTSFRGASSPRGNVPKNIHCVPPKDSPPCHPHSCAPNRRNHQEEDYYQLGHAS